MCFSRLSWGITRRVSKQGDGHSFKVDRCNIIKVCDVTEMAVSSTGARGNRRAATRKHSRFAIASAMSSDIRCQVQGTTSTLRQNRVAQRR